MIAALPSIPAATSRVLVIEHEALFAKALCAVLSGESGLAIVGDAATVDASLLRIARPTLILLDADRPQSDADAAIALCRHAAPDAHLCILSMRPEPILARRCLQAGARAYILKDATPTELRHAIRIVESGAYYVAPQIAGSLLRGRNAATVPTAADDLSDREIEILHVLAEGLSNKEIGVRLRLSEKTVKNNLSRIFSKLGLISRSQAAVYAIKHGLG